MRRGACSFLRAASSNRRLRALSSSSKSYDPEQSRMFDQVGKGRKEARNVRVRSSRRLLGIFDVSCLSLNSFVAAPLGQESIVQVTFNDAPVKPISKRESHLTRLGPVLHRAFSVFHFDSKGR